MAQDNSTIPKWAIFVVCIFLLIPCLIYFIFMGVKHMPLSTDTGDWGAFADYLNPFVSLANLVLLAVITIRLKQAEHDRHDTLLKLEKPILSVFHKPNAGEYWFKNIGRGPAQNIIVYYGLRKNGSEWSRAIVFYGLAPNDEQKIIWTSGISGNAVLVYYEDIFNDCYTAMLINNKSEIKEYGKQKPEIKATETKYLWESEPDKFGFNI